jgi:Tfp pilus assembly protein PilP
MRFISLFVTLIFIFSVFRSGAYSLEAMLQETTKTNKGYIYKHKGRRDPFMPLIVPKKEKAKKGSRIATGTLESYDISDFTLVAIAEKRGQYYALLVTPDNRSFTVNEGTVIGLHKGRVEKILSDKVIIIEYSRNYRGELRPRQIVLELHKGEVE